MATKWPDMSPWNWYYKCIDAMSADNELPEDWERAMIRLCAGQSHDPAMKLVKVSYMESPPEYLKAFSFFYESLDGVWWVVENLLRGKHNDK